MDTTATPPPDTSATTATTPTTAPIEPTEGRPRYDVVIVGGGAAGLAGAVSLARARRSVLVIDAGSPRNAPAGHIHNYLGREGTPPLELLAIGRDEVTGYGGEVVADRVVGVERLDDGFVVSRQDGPVVEARRLLVTTGLVDELPDIAGLAEHWGTDVLHCPYCHGWEVRDQAIAIVATSPLAVHQALLWRQWTPTLTLILHDAPDPTDEQAEQLAALDVTVVRGPVVEVEASDGRISGARLADGEVVPCQALVVAPLFAARGELLAQMGLTIADVVVDGRPIATHVPADAVGATDAPGVWVAGNVTTPMEQVIGSAAAGGRAGHAINMSLIMEDAQDAVEARRRASEPAGGEVEPALGRG